MNISLLKIIENISCPNHYLTQVGYNYDLYVQGLCDVLSKIETKISRKKFLHLVEGKLQLKARNFNEDGYIQTACELTVMNDFINNEKFKFLYENKVTPPKDVDFTLQSEGINYNIEVKCPSFKEIPKSINDISLTLTNRAPTINSKIKVLDDIKSRLEQHGKKITEEKNLDNTLKSFLESAQEKVSSSSQKDVNILVVCCDNAINMQTWRGYLFGWQGFFTDNSYIEHSSFDRVDYVLLTNIYHYHHHFFKKNLINRHWSISTSFNLLYPNKYSKRNKTVIGDVDLKKMNSIFNNHNYNFEKYLKDKNDLPKDEAYEVKEMILGVAWYTDKFKENGLHYFNKQT